MRLGIFGGTFDPPHVGHLICARHVAVSAGLERVLMIPSHIPPHKPERRVSDGALRLRMLQLAIAGDPVLVASGIELEREGPSYSLLTVEQLEQLHPGVELSFIIGADAFAEIDTWYRYTELLGRIDFLLMTRPGAPLPECPSQYAVETSQLWRHASGHSVRLVRVPLLEISSSEIRRRAAAGEPIRYMLPELVRELIEEHGLYR